MALTQLNRKQKYVEFTDSPLMHTTFYFSLVSRVKTKLFLSHPIKCCTVKNKKLT